MSKAAAADRAEPGPDAEPPAFQALPGHLIRRLQQIAVAIFLEETEGHGLTPVQYAALAGIARQPMTDQRSLARVIAFDTSTLGGVIDRLEARGLVQRHASTSDRRVRLLALTEAGRQRLQAVVPPMLRAQQRMLQPLAPAEQAQFLRLLGTLVAGNNAVSRAPGEH